MKDLLLNDCSQPPIPASFSFFLLFCGEVSCLLEWLPGREIWLMHITKRKWREARGQVNWHNQGLGKGREREQDDSQSEEFRRSERGCAQRDTGTDEQRPECEGDAGGLASAERLGKGLTRWHYGFPTGHLLVFFQETEVKCGIPFWLFLVAACLAACVFYTYRTQVGFICMILINGIFPTCEFSCSVVSNSLWPHGLQHTRLLCPSSIPGACSNTCPLSWWCHPTPSYQ